MVEREPIVEQQRVTYEGLFSMAELLRLIEDWQATKGYMTVEKKAIESVKEDGKYIEYWFAPFKKITDYVKFEVWIRILGSGLKEKEVIIDGKKQMLVEGKIQLVFDSYIETDWENRWETKPIFYFVRTIWDKYVYKPFLSGFRQDLHEDTMQIINQVKAFLNLYKK